MPIRSAPLGSPAGTIGAPVTPEFNTDLGCWEYRVSAGGIEVHLDLQAFGWGNAAGSPTLAAIQATVLPDGYSNGQGGDLNPKGWPGSPLDGAYSPRNRCEGGGDLSPCSPPFDTTCDNGNNGDCAQSFRWIMPDCANDLPAIATPTLTYAWATAAQVDCNIDDGFIKTMGGLILEVPTDASGTYVIAFNPDPNNSFMTAVTGQPIPDVVFTPACITVITGRCCGDFGPGTTFCLDNLTEQECQMQPSFPQWVADTTCSECECVVDCIFDPDYCDDWNVCTTDICDPYCGCKYTLNYDEATKCCDPSSGITVQIDDGNVCTIDTCNPFSGHVSHSQNNDIPECVVDIDGIPKNRYISFGTGNMPVNRAFHVRMTASAHFPESVGDLGWVGTPDSTITALVVPEPVFRNVWPPVLRASDCEIVPAATYEIRATNDGVNFDSPVVVETTAAPIDKFWGDIVGDFNGFTWAPPNGVQNIADVQAAIKTFQDGAGTAPLIWADVEPETPNHVVNFNDVLQLVLAFTGDPYPFSAPANCP